MSVIPQAGERYKKNKKSLPAGEALTTTLESDQIFQSGVDVFYSYITDSLGWFR